MWKCDWWTPLLGLKCPKVHRFVEYTLVKCFNKFVQSALNARRQGDEIPISSVVVEVMKLLANSSYGYQFLDRSCTSITRYMNDDKTHAAINNEMFQRLGYINDQLFENELAECEIEHIEPLNVGFFILQYGKSRMWEICDSFFPKIMRD